LSNTKNLWLKSEWKDFSEKVKSRDSYKCLQCGRGRGEVVLQVHHEIYLNGKSPWEYSISDCITLCKGCHARKHDLIEPLRGWELLSINDLGAPIGTCERRGCNSSIRYEHVTYHSDWGYQTVGSTCVEHLTLEDIAISGKYISLYKSISNYVHNAEWSYGKTKKGSDYIEAIYKQSHKIRIYGNGYSHSFQINLKEKGRKYYNFGELVSVKGKNLEHVKELAFIALKGVVAETEDKEVLRGLYRHLRDS
jgi:hypothetical protein